MKKGFFSISLSQPWYEFFKRISFATTQVPKGTYTDTHYHKFFSAYLVKNMDALHTNSGETKMPQYALVIVLPFFNHTRSNKDGHTDACYVGDLSPSHGTHKIYTS